MLVDIEICDTRTITGLSGRAGRHWRSLGMSHTLNGQTGVQAPGLRPQLLAARFPSALEGPNRELVALLIGSTREAGCQIRQLQAWRP